MAEFLPRLRLLFDDLVQFFRASLPDRSAEGHRGFGEISELLGSDRTGEAAGEPLFATALEAARDGVVLARLEPGTEPESLQIDYVNPAFERITGYAPAEVEGSGLEVLVGERTDRSALRRLYRAVEAGDPTKEELAVHRRDGAVRWVEMTAAPVVEENGAADYVVMIQRDVTERKERERLERVEREVLEHVSEGGSVEEGLDHLLGLLEEDEETRAAILLMEQRTGKLRHLAAPSLPEEFQNQIEQVDRGAPVATCGTAYLQNEAVVVTDVEEDERWSAYRALTQRWGLRACWSNPIHASDGSVIGVLAVYHTGSRAPDPDEWNVVRKVTHLASIIIEWKRAEVALEESEHLFRTLAEESLLGIYLIQDEGFRYVNPRFCEITGYEYRELLSHRGLEEIIHPDDYEELRADIKKREEGRVEDDLHREFRIRTGDGEERYVEVFGTPVHYLGKTAVFGTLLDVSDRKDQERQLIDAKEEAEEMNRLKSAFLANMSHEIRTPLTSILGFSEILAEEVPEEGEEFVGLIRQSGERLYQTLNSVLDLSELEAGAVHVGEERIDVAERLETTVDLLLPQAVQKDVQLNLETPPGAVQARVDGASLDRIVTNLVHNAIKFTEEGRVTVRLDATDRTVRIEVEDTGVGMSEEFLPDLFEAFRQESSGLTRSHEGAGLGLTITKRLVDILDGTIEVESVKGEGTTFTVELPRDPEV